MFSYLSSLARTTTPPSAQPTNPNKTPLKEKTSAAITRMAREFTQTRPPLTATWNSPFLDSLPVDQKDYITNQVETFLRDKVTNSARNKTINTAIDTFIKEVSRRMSTTLESSPKHDFYKQAMEAAIAYRTKVNESIDVPTGKITDATEEKPNEGKPESLTLVQLPLKTDTYQKLAMAILDVEDPHEEGTIRLGVAAVLSLLPRFVGITPQHTLEKFKALKALSPIEKEVLDEVTKVLTRSLEKPKYKSDEPMLWASTRLLGHLAYLVTYQNDVFICNRGEDAVNEDDQFCDGIYGIRMTSSDDRGLGLTHIVSRFMELGTQTEYSSLLNTIQNRGRPISLETEIPGLHARVLKQTVGNCWYASTKLATQLLIGILCKEKNIDPHQILAFLSGSTLKEIINIKSTVAPLAPADIFPDPQTFLGSNPMYQPRTPQERPLGGAGNE